MDELICELRRIATALEAQNTITEKWITQQAKWREEDDRVVEQRYQEKIDLDRHIFMFQRECHSEAERLNAERYQEIKARDNKVAMAAIDHYTRQNEET